MGQEQERTNRGASAGGSGASTQELFETQVQADVPGSCYQALRGVKCQFHRGVLTLRGQVPSYYHKRVAQVLTRRRLFAAGFVRNELEVVASTAGDRRSPEKPGWTQEGMAKREGGES